jgi:hypothetical protein
MKLAFQILFAYAILALGIMLIACGCQSSAYQEGDYTGQGLAANYTAPAVPGAVVSTHQDGSQTVVPLPSDKSAPAVVAPPNPSPVVSVQIIPTVPGVVTSYTVTPEIQKGDKTAGSRVMTWAGEAPGTVTEQVATQKVARIHNALPSVSVDATGVHVSAGGGSSDVQAGLSIWQRLWVWFNDTFKDLMWWVVIGGVVLLAFFVLPIALPFLKPIFSSILTGLKNAWAFITGEFTKLWTAIANFHNKPSAVSLSPAATSTATSTTPVPDPTPTQIQSLTTQVTQATETTK